MVIDFSKGIDYWIDLIKRLLDSFADFVYSLTGIQLYATSTDGVKE